MNRPVHFRHVSKLPVAPPPNVVGKMTLPSAEEAAKADAELLARKAALLQERQQASQTSHRPTEGVDTNRSEQSRP